MGMSGWAHALHTWLRIIPEYKAYMGIQTQYEALITWLHIAPTTTPIAPYTL